jgi:hypothetical protein
MDSVHRLVVRIPSGMGVGIVGLVLAVQAHTQQQIVDPDFKVVVEQPAYQRNSPTVAIDEAHSNTHTARGLYRPLADLLTSDGYRVVASTRQFETGIFSGVDVLVVANANARNFTGSVFTDAECDVVRDWVSAGGSLLLMPTTSHSELRLPPSPRGLG